MRHFRTEVGPGMRRMLAAAVRETLAFRPNTVVHHAKALTAPAVGQEIRTEQGLQTVLSVLETW